MATIVIPTPLRKFTQNQTRVTVKGKNIEESLVDLTTQFPDLRKYLLDEKNKLRRFVTVFLDTNDISDLEEEKTVVAENHVISIIPAIAGGTPEGEVTFSKAELERYNRHIIIPGFGLEAQQKLKAAKVLVVGSGGLGSPLLLYLAAAGVGHIGIVDFDVVDDSNLQRQVLFGVSDVGKSKVEAAKARLKGLNPFIEITTYNTQLTSENALEIIGQYDVVADGTDNFPTRYLVNDASVIAGVPNVYASIFQFEGQVSVFNYTDASGETGPNYRDLYPTPPPAGLIPNCAEGGVLGVLPGIIGSLQANEVIKVITGVGEPLSGRFFVFDALSFETKTFNITKKDHTPVINELIDYEQFCGVRAVEPKIKEIDAAGFQNWITRGENIQVIDVREPVEYEEENINGLLIPLATVLERANEIARDKKVVVHCKLGGRSAKAIRELEEKGGFANLYNLKGGIKAYLQHQQETTVQSIEI